MNEGATGRLTEVLDGRVGAPHPGWGYMMEGE